MLRSFLRDNNSDMMTLEVKRGILELLNVRGTLAIENEQKVVCIYALLDSHCGKLPKHCPHQVITREHRLRSRPETR